MSTAFTVKPTHKTIQGYYAALRAYADQDVDHEGAVRTAFQNLLSETGRRVGWTLIPELPGSAAGHSIRPDGTFRDAYYIERAHWEAKDTADDLETEIKKKIALGYPLTNIIFEDTRSAVLYQNGRREMEADLTKPRALADLLNAFFSHTEPAHEDFKKAVDEFKQRVPDLARGLVELIADSHKNNPRFIKAFDAFYDLCKASLNPNLSRAAVDEMLVQHLLTERLIRTIFDNQDFTRRNVIAAEVEKVIDALVSKAFNRHGYLRQLDRFYLAIEGAAGTIQSFAEKQHFLNVVYERFFQGYSVKVADTHGIIYTPQEIVDFMCASVEEVLKTEFGKSLGDREVHILDPCTGTGNFIVNLLRRIPKRDLPRMYKEQLFANEVMLLPYYIAALNIEHAYFEQTGEYEPFEGLCFVDSLDLAEAKQAGFSFMTEENTARVERQKRTPITVIIGNPPYNMGQQNENDNNKNRNYEIVDNRIQSTYVKDSNATLNTKLYDAYVRFFRWATDRLGPRLGIVCFVSNNGFLRGIAFDGFRKCLLNEFDLIYHFDFKGDARTSGEPRRQEGGNIFHDQIRVGVGITILVRRAHVGSRELRYHAVGDYWRAARKATYLASFQSCAVVPWQQLTPDERNSWFVPANADDYQRLIPIGSKSVRSSTGSIADALFKTYSPGVNTARDAVVYGYNAAPLADVVQQFCEDYNSEVDRYHRKGTSPDVDGFVNYSRLKWSSTLKEHLRRGQHSDFDRTKIRIALYRPFTCMFLYYDTLILDRPGAFSGILASQDPHGNRILCTTGIGSNKPFHVLATTYLPSFDLLEKTPCFPFYLYDEDGSNRRENITDWSLRLFREHYGDKKITKWDIFNYVYGILHHRAYREKFADCLKRELPRIPLASSRDDFRAFRDAGKGLAKLHLEYESLDPWALKWIETPGEPLSYRVEKMKLSKDKKTLTVNDSLALGGIPPEVFDYRLGNRSALECVIDQYRISTDKRSGITRDPNRPDDPEYIVRLVGQVVRVSVETVHIVEGLPREYGTAPSV